MKKYLIPILSLTLLFTSCDNDDDNTQIENNQTLTTEEGKQALENNSIEVVQAIDNFRNDSDITKVIDFLTRVIEEQESIDNSNEDSLIISEAKRALAFTEKANNMVSNHISIDSSDDEDSDNDLQNEFNDSVGIHTYNSETKEFDFTESDNGQIVVSTTSDNETGTMTISNFSTTNHVDENDELPTSINTEIKIDDSILMNMSYSLTIEDNEYIPSSINNTVSLGPMSYSLNISSDNESILFEESSSIDNTPLLNISANINGGFNELFSEGNIDLINFETIDTSISIGKSTLNISGNKPEEDESYFEIENDEELTNLLNELFTVSISSEDSEIAQGEFYTYEEEYTTYDYNTNSYVKDTTETILDIRMVFPDESKSTLEAYFEVGFDDLINHMESTIENYYELTETE